MAAAPLDRPAHRRDRTTHQPHRAWLDAVLRGVLPLRAESVLQRINAYLMRLLRDKYKRLRPIKKAKAAWQRITGQDPRLFAHWAWASASWWTGRQEPGDQRLSRRDLWEPGGEIPRATRQ